MTKAQQKKTGTSETQNLMMEGGGEVEQRIDPDQPVTVILKQVLEQQYDLQRRLAHLEAQQGRAAMYMPRAEIPLSRPELDTYLNETPTAWLEVLEDYNRGPLRLNKGKVFCIQNYTNIPQHVGAGLKVMGAVAPR